MPRIRLHHKYENKYRWYFLLWTLVCHGEDEETSARWHLHFFIGSCQTGSRSVAPSFPPLVLLSFCCCLFSVHVRYSSLRPWRKILSDTRARPLASVPTMISASLRLTLLPHLILQFCLFQNLIKRENNLDIFKTRSLDCKEESCDTSEGSVYVCVFTFLFQLQVLFYFIFFYLPKFNRAEFLCMESSPQLVPPNVGLHVENISEPCLHFKNSTLVETSKQAAHSPFFSLAWWL